MTAHVRIAALISALKAGEPLAAEDARWLGSSLESERPLRALGLARAPGQRSLATIAATARRDQLFREAGAKYLTGLSNPKQADKLYEGFIRYHDSAWHREKIEAECPARHHGRVTGFYWQILKARDRHISRKMIYQIISH